MPVRKHGHGWEVRVQSAGVRFSKTVKSKRDAHELEAKVRQRLNDSQLGRTPKYTLEEALTRWLTGEATTLKSYDNLKDKVRTIYPHVKGKYLHEIVEVAEEVKRKGLEKGLSPATINRRVAILRRVANIAFVRWDWLPDALGKRITLVSGERSRNTYLTAAEVNNLAINAPEKVSNAIRLAAMSGLRKGELLSLTESHRRDGCIYLSDSKNGRPRIVPLPPEAQAIPLPLGLTESELRKGFESAREKTGMKHVRFHDLRHTYASWLVQSGVGLTVVRDLLGHSSLSVTSRYSHLATEHLKEAVNATFKRG